jgi:hypothetical protein
MQRVLFLIQTFMLIYTMRYWLARRGLTATAGTTFIRAILTLISIIEFMFWSCDRGPRCLWCWNDITVPWSSCCLKKRWWQNTTLLRWWKAPKWHNSYVSVVWKKRPDVESDEWPNTDITQQKHNKHTKPHLCEKALSSFVMSPLMFEARS